MKMQYNRYIQVIFINILRCFIKVNLCNFNKAVGGMYCMVALNEIKIYQFQEMDSRTFLCYINIHGGHQYACQAQEENTIMGGRQQVISKGLMK